MAPIGVPRNFAVGIIWKVQHIHVIWNIEYMIVNSLQK